MAAKRKGGLKVDDICAKLRRQVVPATEVMSNANPELLHDCEKDKPIAHPSSEKLNVGQTTQVDLQRREVIEKWVNGELVDEALEEQKAGSGEALPEVVCIAKGLKVKEVHGDHPATPPPMQTGNIFVKQDSNAGIANNKNLMALGQIMAKPSCIMLSASSLGDYTTPSSQTFLGPIENRGQRGSNEMVRKINFDYPFIPTSNCNPTSFPREVTLSRCPRISKYEKYIQKLQAGEPLGGTPHQVQNNELSLQREHTVQGSVHQQRSGINFLETECGAAGRPLPSVVRSPVPSLPRTSKYDILIENLKKGEALSAQNENLSKKPSKYDPENVKYLHLFKTNQGVQEIDLSVPFKFRKVGRPSKYDVPNFQQITPDNAAARVASLTPVLLVSTASRPAVTVVQDVPLSFNNTTTT
ncbi:zinc finger protein castor homolog 1-like [Ambystoma mexicanum]|uniref:zinc finger protein castor homolog 1-like n=1 Tax=Ambystoma mexicanum TaxID=8296 RepID=UPI0037E91AA4